MSKTVTSYFGFTVASIFVLGIFVTATSYVQLAVAILLYPALVFFAYKVLPLRKRVHEEISEETISNKSEPLNEEGEEDANDAKRGSFTISDIDKRAFLKLIGGAGVLLFIFSLFNKRAEGLFYKNVSTGAVAGQIALEDIKGNKINPAQAHPTDGYRVAELDDGLVAFYGYINKAGSWFVMKLDSDSGSFRYAKGEKNFPSNWSNRQNLEYDYYNNVFT